MVWKKDCIRGKEFIVAHAEHIILEGADRTTSGKGPARRLRVAGRIPAVVYGGIGGTEAIDVPIKELLVSMRAGMLRRTIFALKRGDNTVRIIAKDIQLHPVKDIPVHIDFLRLSDNSTIVLDVPIEVVDVDKAPVLKRGGKLQITTRRIRLRVPADAIPEKISVSLAGVDGRKVVHAADLTMPEGCSVVRSGDDLTILTVKPPVR